MSVQKQIDALAEENQVLMSKRNEIRAMMKENQKKMDELAIKAKVERFAAKNNIVIAPEAIKSAEAVGTPG